MPGSLRVRFQAHGIRLPAEAEVRAFHSVPEFHLDRSWLLATRAWAVALRGIEEGVGRNGTTPTPESGARKYLSHQARKTMAPGSFRRARAENWAPHIRIQPHGLNQRHQDAELRALLALYSAGTARPCAAWPGHSQPAARCALPAAASRAARPQGPAAEHFIPKCNEGNTHLPPWALKSNLT